MLVCVLCAVCVVAVSGAAERRRSAAERLLRGLRDGAADGDANDAKTRGLQRIARVSGTLFHTESICQAKHTTGNVGQ